MTIDPFDLSQPMQNHVRWRLQYRQRRYCKHLSRLELNRRIRDIVLNVLTLTNEAKIGLRALETGGAELIEKWTHVLEEMVLRYGPYPSGFDRDILQSEPFPDFVSELASKAAQAMARLSLKPGDAFVRFGSPEVMRMLHADGRLRIQPATSFQAPNYNGAVRDDELTIGISLNLDRDGILAVVSNPDDVPPDAPDQRVDIALRHATDFWLYCVTTSIQPRLFVDFDATACVIIKDRDEFRRRIREAASAAILNSEFREGEAVYFDSLLPGKSVPFVPFTKPFGYLYQSEYRFCWLPSKVVAQVTPIDIELGSLRGISELIEL